MKTFSFAQKDPLLSSSDAGKLKVLNSLRGKCFYFAKGPE